MASGYFGILNIVLPSLDTPLCGEMSFVRGFADDADISMVTISFRASVCCSSDGIFSNLSPMAILASSY